MALTAQCRVYVAFGQGPLVETPTWTEVTQWVRHVRTSRGGTSEIDQPGAGTCTVVLDNRDRRFDPDYASGAYHPGWQPRVQIKVEAVHESNTYPIFRGVVQRLAQGWDGPRDAVCTVTATDLLGFLARWPLAETAHGLLCELIPPTLLFGLDAVDMVDRSGRVTGQYGANRIDAPPLEAGGLGASRHVAPMGVETMSAVGSFGAFTETASTRLTVSAIAKVDWLAEFYSGLVLVDVSAMFVELRGGGYSYVMLGVTQTGRPTGYISMPGGGVTLVGPDPITDGRPHHLAVVRDGTWSELWVDGVMVDSATTAPMTAAGTPTEGRVGVGPHGRGLDGFNFRWVDRGHDMTVDEVAIWQDVALPGWMLEALAAAAVGGWNGDPAGVRIGRVLGHLGVPAGLFDLDPASMSTGVFSGSRDALDIAQATANSDLGRLFVAADGVIRFRSRAGWIGAGPSITFADDATSGAVRYRGWGLHLDVAHVSNEVTAIGVHEARHTEIDTGSRAELGPLGVELETAVGTDQQCRDIARTVLARRNTPRTRGDQWIVHPDRHVIGSSTTRAWAQVLGVELGDIAAIRRTPPTGPTRVDVVEVTQIAHEIEPQEGLWRVTFAGAPADTTPVFRWGVSEWDGAHGWG